jgi:cellobiose phosphorylase
MSTSDYFQFDDENRAIRIKRFDTPQPWINYLSNGEFHAFVSQAGGGFAWWHSPVCLRLTRYRQYNLPLDSPGFYVYIRHEDGCVWSPTHRPCETPLDAWEAVHQPGITTFHAEKKDLQATLSFFVTPDYDALVWDLTLTNVGKTTENLSTFAYTEYSQVNWESESQWGYYSKLHRKTWYDELSQTSNYLHHGHNPRAREVPLIFLASTSPVASHSGSRTHFLGDYRDERNPIGVERDHCGNHFIQAGETISALQNKLTLEPGESRCIRYFLGIAPGALVDLDRAGQERDRILSELRQTGRVDAQREKVHSWWREHFATFQCRIPDAPAQRMINTWNVVNSVVTGRYSRSVNTFAPGVRGIGFRDSSQDMLAIAYRKPDWATDMLRFLLSQQYRDGHVVHYAFPEERKPPMVSIHSDDHLWPPLAVYAILSETGDFSLLDEKVPYLADNHIHRDGEGTIWEHLMDAMRFTDNNLGAHGLPLTFRSDWNDIIGRFNRHGRSETVFAGMQYVLCLRYLTAIAEETGRKELDWIQDCLKRQVDALLACAWDGAWWRRGFDDDGVAVGSNSSDYGKLFLNPQSWAVLCGLGTREQQRAGMDAVHQLLKTEVGLKLLHPPFASWSREGEPKVGYGPGCGENGAIFCHANTWAIIAETLLGHADHAWEYFAQLIPANAMAKVGIDRYRAEPYAWVSNIVGPENNCFGWANVEQITGPAPWMDVAATQYLLGIRPTLSGLLIAPCIPAGWPGFQISRRYRGCMLDIRIRNESGSGKGVQSITIDGRAITGVTIMPEDVSGRHSASVVAVM